MTAPDLVPELLVTDITRSLAFWCDLCGFEVAYERPEEGFAYLTRGTAHVMLEQRGSGRNWVPARVESPFGRGVNFQIGVPDLDPILTALAGSDWPLFMEPESRWYRVSDTEEAGVRQFLVADPDGYLIRFQTSTGHRPVAGTTHDESVPVHTTVVVDAANCVGSVPDGWWRDRAGATRRLRDSLSSDALRHDLQLAATPALVLVVEGRARGVQSTPTVQVVHAPGIGDDMIVKVVEQRAAQGESIVVVTADRELRTRVAALGARTVGPRVVRPS